MPQSVEPAKSKSATPPGLPEELRADQHFAPADLPVRERLKSASILEGEITASARVCACGGSAGYPPTAGMRERSWRHRYSPEKRR